MSFIATFAEVLSDFGLASTIARMSNFGVLTYGIYAAASDYPVDFPAAGAQALVLLGLVLLVVLLSIVTALLLTFIRTVFELPISQMLIPQKGPPAPTLVLKLFNHDEDGLACAIALVAMIVAGGRSAAIWGGARFRRAGKGAVRRGGRAGDSLRRGC